MADTLEHGEAMLRLERLEQHHMLLLQAHVPPEIVQDAETLEKSLSELRGESHRRPGLRPRRPCPRAPLTCRRAVSLKAEQLEAELETAIGESDRLRADNGSLNDRIYQVS